MSKGVVAAGDPQTAEAGATLLRAGGNAVDAAVAAAFAAFVCELPLCSPLGGAVLVVESVGKPIAAFDMFARTPGLGGSAPSDKDFVGMDVSFGAAAQRFHVGRASVAVPLTLPGLLEVHRRYGKLPLSEVVAPAVALGRSGYVLGAGLAYVFQILRPIASVTRGCRVLFEGTHGDLAKAGETLFNRDLASTLETLGKAPEGTLRDIYRLLASEMSPANGGLITERDVDQADAVEHAPVVTEQGGWRIATMPYPSTGGVLVALGLRMLEGVAKAPFLSHDHVFSVARVQEALLRERDDTFVDRCADPEAVRRLLSDEHVTVARRAARKNLLGSTTQISAIDESGSAVALTLTSGEGAGHVLPGTGMIANNLLGEEDLHPRGFHQDPPGHPINTMMAPTIVSRGADRMALGSGGSNRLRTAILQVLVNLIDYGMSDDAAVSAPRLHLEAGPKLAFEKPGLDSAVVDALIAEYPNAAVFDAPNLFFGGVHLATRLNGIFAGVGDARRSGACIVV